MGDLNTGSSASRKLLLPIAALLLVLLLVGGYVLLGDGGVPAADPSAPPPVRLLVEQTPNDLVCKSPAVFQGRVEGPGYLVLNGARIETEPDGIFTAFVALEEGSNVLVLRCVGQGGDEVERLEKAVTLDSNPPTVRFDAPIHGDLTGEEQVEVRGALLDLHPSHVMISGSRVDLAPDGTFRGMAELSEEGENRLEVLGFDIAGNCRTESLTVDRDTTDPRLEIEFDPSMSLTWDASVMLPFRILDPHPSHLLVNGERRELPSEEGDLGLDLAVGENRFEILAVDRVGRRSAPVALVVERLVATGPGTTPEATFLAAQNAVREKNWAAIADFMAPSQMRESAAEFEKNKGGPGGAMMAAIVGIDAEKLKTMSFRDFMAAMLAKMAEKDPEEMEAMLSQKVTDTEIEGDRATLTLKDADGKEDTVKLVLEDGRWYMADFG